jgi:hypothetical protein
VLHGVGAVLLAFFHLDTRIPTNTSDWTHWTLLPPPSGFRNISPTMTDAVLPLLKISQRQRKALKARFRCEHLHGVYFPLPLDSSHRGRSTVIYSLSHFLALIPEHSSTTCTVVHEFQNIERDTNMYMACAVAGPTTTIERNIIRWLIATAALHHQKTKNIIFATIL